MRHRSLTLVAASMAMLAGCARPPAPEPAPVAPPLSRLLPAPEAARGDAGSPEGAMPVRVCVIWSGELLNVRAQYDPATGDVLLAGRRVAEIFPPGDEYAAGKAWYVNNEPIELRRVCYVKYGLPRLLEPAEIRKVGEYRGMALFTGLEEAGERHPPVLYVPVEPGCSFQSYQYEPVSPLRSCDDRW